MGNTAKFSFGSTKITDTAHPVFTMAWNLYKKSFPKEERRQLQSQKKIMSWTEYNFELIANQNQFVGFIAWWNFNDWRYIEHFSTLPSLRGNGYGFQMIADFIAKSCLPVILEVELPTDDINRRRIGFYQRAGFVLNEHQYKHPPYKKGKKYVPLKIMTYPNAITNENLQHFIKKYHPVIHKLVL